MATQTLTSPFQPRLDWNKLLSTPQWTPLNELRWTVSRVRDYVYELVEGAYVVAVPYDLNLRPTAGAMSLTAAIWAETKGAVLRAQCLAVEDDVIDATQTPPAEMLLEPSVDTYEGIFSLITRLEGRSPIESATYRIASDGAFIHRTIFAQCGDFYFRSLSHQPNEKCYAILRRLKPRSPTSS